MVKTSHVASFLFAVLNIKDVRLVSHFKLSLRKCFFFFFFFFFFFLSVVNVIVADNYCRAYSDWNGCILSLK